MSDIDDYVRAATRDNTRRSYRSAIDHYELAWDGLLPATPDNIARYLAAFAGDLAVSTLQHRLAALSGWHVEHGFADPTKAPLVRKVMRGIRQVHPHRQKQARPVQIALLERLDTYLSAEAQKPEMPVRQLRAKRDKALVLLGFWRAFRSDELCRLQVTDIVLAPDRGLEIFLPASKADRSGHGHVFKCPALGRLCPVQAYTDWIESAHLTDGPVFRRIDRWGRIGSGGLHPNSVVPLLRNLVRQAGAEDHDHYSSHSLRRGFASWANDDGWDVKSLMEYVGWRDMKSALRYIDSLDPFQRARNRGA